MTFLNFPRYSGYSIQVKWANVHAVDVKFSPDLTHQKSLKSVNFWQSYLKNKRGTFFWDTVYITIIYSDNMLLAPVAAQKQMLVSPLSCHKYPDVLRQLKLCLLTTKHYKYQHVIAKRHVYIHITRITATVNHSIPSAAFKVKNAFYVTFQLLITSYNFQLSSSCVLTAFLFK